MCTGTHVCAATSVNVHMRMDIYVCACVWLCVQGVYGGQRSMLAILSQQSSALSFEDRITHLGLMDI